MRAVIVSLKERAHLGDIGINGRIIVWIGFLWSKTKYMRIMRNVMGERSDLRVEGMAFEEFTNFKY
jgi:hypothetical protein